MYGSNSGMYASRGIGLDQGGALNRGIGSDHGSRASSIPPPTNYGGAQAEIVEKAIEAEDPTKVPEVKTRNLPEKHDYSSMQPPVIMIGDVRGLGDINNTMRGFGDMQPYGSGWESAPGSGIPITGTETMV